MNPFAGKTPSERNKIIAAAVLGVLALSALFMAFGPSVFSRKVTVTTPTTAAKPSPSPGSTAADFDVPSQEEVNFQYETTPIAYNGGDAYAPEAGRNIFAFYEPPPPCLTCTPTPKPTVIPTPVPQPTPHMLLAMVSPQNVYAGAGNFRLEIGGDKFDPASRVYFNQSEVRTTFVSPQQLVAEIPSGLISQEGEKQIIVQTPDGKTHSNQMMLTVQAPPKPQFQYIGMIARAKYNNDTAYFIEPGKQVPFGARLNDVVAGRFRVTSISSDEVVLQDTQLGFNKARLPLYRPSPGAVSGAGPAQGPPNRRNRSREDFPTDGGYIPYTPPAANGVPQNIPGIPNNIPRYVPPRPPQQIPQPQEKKDVDDNDEDGDN
jgi:hypothetical protein